MDNDSVFLSYEVIFMDARVWSRSCSRFIHSFFKSKANAKRKSSTWAIFPGTGTNQSVQELERRIFTEWFPTSGYEYGDAPDIEVYINPDPQNTIFEVWVPVKKKQS